MAITYWAAHLALIITTCVIAGCTQPDWKAYPNYELIDQILRPRRGHEGMLVNRVCQKYEKNKCVDWKTTQYNLSNKKFRLDINRLNFVCNIAGKRYKICKDKPGFCHRIFKKRKCVLWVFCKKRKLKKEEYIPIKNFDFLINANTKCFNKDRYAFED